MQPFWTWVDGHQALVVFVLGAVLNAVTRLAKAHKSTSKFWVAVDAGIGRILPGDVDGFVRDMLAIFGKPPTGGAGGDGADKALRPYDPDFTPTSPSRIVKRTSLMLAASTAVLAASLTLSGCGLLHSAIPTIDKILLVVQDAELVIAPVEKVIELFFAAHPDDKRAIEFAKVDRDLHLSLDALTRLGDAGKSLDDGDVAAAVADAQKAYADFMSFAASLGVDAPAPGRPTIGAGAHVATRPLLMDLHVESKP